MGQVKALRVRCDYKHLPKRLYLFRTLEEAGEAFPNCYVLHNVDWSAFPDLQVYLEKSGEAANDYPFVAIPYHTFPTPEGDRVVAKKRWDTLTEVIEHRFEKPSFKAYASPLISKMCQMSIFTEGKHYDSPCQTCLRFMEHVYNKCDIVQNDGKKHCHFSLLFSKETTAS